MMFPDSSEVGFVFEVKPEDACMVVGTECLVSVFTACVVSELPFVFSETLEELLEVWFVKTSVFWEVFFVVSER